MLLRRLLFNHQIFGIFLSIFLVLISTVIPLWLKHTLYKFIILNLLKFVLGTRMWFIWRNVQCELERNVYSAVDEWNVYKHQLWHDSWWCYWGQHILTRFLPAYSINYRKRCVELSKYNCKFLYFFKFYFFACIFWSSIQTLLLSKMSCWSIGLFVMKWYCSFSLVNSLLGYLLW